MTRVRGEMIRAALADVRGWAAAVEHAQNRQELDHARHDRDAAILRSLAVLPLADVADAAGIIESRVKQIVERARAVANERKSA